MFSICVAQPNIYAHAIKPMPLYMEQHGSVKIGLCLQMGSNIVGWAVGGGAVASTALYQIWAGTKQKELGAGSMQVLPSLVLFCQLLWPLLSFLSRAPAQLTGY